MTGVVPKGRIVNVAFSVAVPETASREEVLEWVTSGLGAGSLSMSNPLIDHDLEAITEPNLEDSGRYLETMVESLGGDDSSALVRRVVRALPDNRDAGAVERWKSPAEHVQEVAMNRANRGKM